MKKFIIGLEIESVCNKDLIPETKVYSYHGGILNKKLKYWKCETDGSLSGHDFRNSQLIEFVSKKLTSKKAFFEALKYFKRYISKNNPKLSETIKFNSSCGMHIHISFKESKFQDRFFYTLYPKIRDKFFELIQASHIQSKEDILKHYFRTAADKFDKTQLNTTYKKRYSEFNFISEDNNRGLEWRSPNLLNVSSWSNFDEFFEIIFSILEYMYDLLNKYSTNFKEEINVNNIIANKNLQIKRLARKHYINVDLNKIRIINAEVKVQSRAN